MAETSESSLDCMICFETFWANNLTFMPCGQHRYCDGCFCSTLETAIAHESNHPIPCGATECPHPNFQQVEAMLRSLPGVDATQRDDLLTRYASRLPEYETPIPDRTYCSEQTCMAAQGHSRFLDVNTCGLGDELSLRCPDCNMTTCIHCKRPMDGVNPGAHSCTRTAQDAAAYVASLPDDEKWQWQQCGRCNAWVGKEGESSCNHMECWDGCRFQFCLICGQEWEDGATLCTRGCPKYGLPVYDADGYNQHGYHRDTGLDRGGFPRAHGTLPSEETAPEYDGWIHGTFDDADLASTGWANGTGLEDGEADFLNAGNNTNTGPPPPVNHPGHLYLYNGWGMDVEGYDVSGYNYYGVDRQGRDRNGLDEQEKIAAIGRDVWF